MNVYGYTNNEEGIMDIKGTTESFEEFVNGYVKVISLTAEYVIVCNTESSIDSEMLEPNIAWFDHDEMVDIICGKCFVCRHINGNLSGIAESDIPIIKSMIIKHKEWD